MWAAEGGPEWLRIEALGPLRAWRGGTSLKLGPIKRQAVLAALLLRDGVRVSHERLLDDVWGTEPPPTGVKVLPSYINPLRRLLDDEGTPPDRSVIHSGQGWYRMAPDDVRLDLADLAERGDAASRIRATGDLPAALDQLTSTLSLFRGEPLAGLPGPFLRDERERLLDRRRALRLERLDCLVRLHRFHQALDDIGAFGTCAPYDEALLAARMRALYGCERQADALNAYHEMRARLRDDLGIDPGEELRRVYEAVLRKDDTYLIGNAGPSESTARGNVALQPAELPRDVAGFVGRSEELALLDELLPADADEGLSGAVVISAIGGSAGIGKTALAVRWAHRVRSRFPDGQLSVNLHGFDHDRPPLGIGEALEALLSSLGLGASEIPADAESQARLYRSLLAGKRVLILLDNAASAEQVRPLLPGGGSSCVLVTSRNRLGELVAHDGARALSLDLLASAEAHTLLRAILGAERLTAEPAALDALIARCGGLPLVLRVASARLAGDPGLRLSDLVAELDEGNRLEALEPDRAATSLLRAAFSASYARLPDTARRAFRLLGLFPGAEFTAEATAALLATSPRQARRFLGTLTAAHLIEPVTAGRYRFHDLLREFARERAVEDESDADAEAALSGLLTWYLHATHAAAGSWFAPELYDSRGAADAQGLPSTVDGEKWLEAERANLLAMIHHVGRHGPRYGAWHLNSGLFGYFWIHLPRATWLDAVVAGLDAAVAEGDLLGQAVMHSILGIIHWDKRQAGKSFAHHAQVMELGGKAEWPAAEIAARGGRGFVEWSMASLESAYENFSTALDAVRDDEYRQITAFGHLGMGMTCRDLGRLHEAVGHLALAAQQRKWISWWDDSLAVQFLGAVYHELGRYQEGLALLRPSTDHDEQSGYRNGRAMMLDALAKIHVDLGRYDEALREAEQAYGMVHGPGRPWVRATILNTIAAAHRGLGHTDRSIGIHTRALELAREARHRRTEADCILGLALTHERRGAHGEAREHAELTVEIARDHSFRVVEGQALTALCAVARSEGDRAAAERIGHEALAIHRETGHRPGEARTRILLGRPALDVDSLP
ncbi:BTAD domain-containing putative transcriptional regulator [Streptomyces sp. NPDC059897]|uniref:AfsR/SARP family transcriptional regulator n=1 Tax=Streptomyces sp. NPDC059897 TaxID=3346994 RepID=UPI00365134E5